jgi:hypothetical protein
MHATTNKWYSSVVHKEFRASLKTHASAPTADQKQLERMKESLARLGVTQDLAHHCAPLREILAGRAAPLPEDFKTIHDYLQSHIPMENVVDAIACLQEHHPKFVPLLELPTVSGGVTLGDFMKLVTARGGLVFNVKLSSGFEYEPTAVEMHMDPAASRSVEELNQFQEMLSRNTCSIKRLNILGYHGPRSSKGIAMAEAIKNSNSIAVECSPHWFPYIGPSTRHIIVTDDADKQTTLSLLAQGNIESVDSADLTIIEGLLDAEKQGSRVTNVAFRYPEFPDIDPDRKLTPQLLLQQQQQQRLEYGTPIVKALFHSNLVTHYQVPSTRLLPPDQVMIEWLKNGPVHWIVFEKAAHPNFVPTANQVLLRKGMLTAASLEGAAKAFSRTLLGINPDLPPLNVHIVGTCLPTARAPALALVNKEFARRALYERRNLYPVWGGTPYVELGPSQITDAPRPS